MIKRTELNCELLTVEAVVMVVGVAVIALFSDVSVHNTITTPAHLDITRHTRQTQHVQPQAYNGYSFRAHCKHQCFKGAYRSLYLLI